MTWLVDAVNIAEGGRKEVAAPLAKSQTLSHLERVRRRAVEFGARFPRDAILLASDDADLELHDRVRTPVLWLQLDSDSEILVQWEGGAVPHVRLEQRRLASGHSLLPESQKGSYQSVQLVRRAVVRVEGHRDRGPSQTKWRKHQSCPAELSGRMNRLRAAYVELDPAIERYVVTSPHDDHRGVWQTYNHRLGPNEMSNVLAWSGTFIPFVTSGLAAAFAAFVAVACNAPGPVVGIVAAAGGLYPLLTVLMLGMRSTGR